MNTEVFANSLFLYAFSERCFVKLAFFQLFKDNAPRVNRGSRCFNAFMY